tara:strand:+ start:734 stop:1591 length:858 start_codon:yes stop_codon:yes gene_type:complete
MKYFLISLFVIIFLLVIFFIRPEEDFVDAKDNLNPLKNVKENASVGRQIIKYQNSKPRNVKNNPDSKKDDLIKLGQEIIDEVSECERKFDEVLSVPINEISTIDNQSLIYVLEEFDEMKLGSPKLGKLLSQLADDKNTNFLKNKEAVENLSLIRPCRPFEKVSLINELTKRYNDNKADVFFSNKIKKSIRLFLNKELEHSVNLSTINMLSNIVMSLVDDGVFDSSMKDSVELLIEDLENDFDDLVDLAEDTLESEDSDFDTKLLKKEAALSRKYKSRLLVLIDKI